MKNTKLILVLLALAFFAGHLTATQTAPVRASVVFDASTPRQNYISRYIAMGTRLLSVLDEAKALKQEFDTRDLTNGIVNGDFVGDNDHLTAAQFKDAVGNVESYRALFFSNFYDANVYRLKR